MSEPTTLSAYPWIIVRFCCDLCGRRGQFRLARLAAKYGPERPLLEVLDAVTADCTARNTSAYDHAPGWRDGCRARFADLPVTHPPDLPPSMAQLRVIEGGKPAKPSGYVPRSARTPRRAYGPDGRAFEPVSIGGMRANGDPMRVTAYCETLGCGHSGVIDVAAWADDIYVPDIGLYLTCSGCKKKGTARIMPERRNWRDGRDQPPPAAE